MSGYKARLQHFSEVQSTLLAAIGVADLTDSGSIAALTVEGRPAWVNRDVSYYSQHGLGGSPILYKDTLIMSFDGSSDGPDKALGWQKPWEQSFLLALDRKTGKERWRAKRGLSRIAHTTPIVVAAGGRDELVSSAGDVIQGFDPATGARRWSVRAVRRWAGSYSTAPRRSRARGLSRSCCRQRRGSP